MIRRAFTRFASQTGIDLAARGGEVRAAPGQDVGDPRRPHGSPDAIRAGRAGAAKRRRRQPWHSTPYQALPPVYVHNASLEIAWTRVVFEQRTIAGDTLVPFVTEVTKGLTSTIRTTGWWPSADADGAGGAAPVPRPSYFEALRP
jgi:hypothetical protein